MTKPWQRRFFTVLNSISQAMTPIGLLIAGPVADRFGVQVWFLIGSASLLVMCAIVFWTPAIMQLEDHRYAEQPVSSAA